MSQLDARLTAARSPDGQRAKLEVVAGEPLEPTRDDLAAWLASKGIAFGLDEGGLEYVRAGLQRADFKDRRLIAAGFPPEAGQHGSLTWHAAALGSATGSKRDDGSVDHRARNAIRAVKAGDRLAEVHDPKPGVPGRKVGGEELAPPPVHDALPKKLGPGVERRGSALLATRTGVLLHREGEVLDVVDHLVHAGHAGMGSGDLEAIGSLTITGNVESGTRVRCKADLCIQGYAEGATLVVGGNASIKGGLLGQGTGEVRCGGDITAGHAGNIRLFCGGTLTLERSAVHTHARARAINLGDGRGTWLGGEAAAETSIIVGDSGSRSHDITVLAAAQPLEPHAPTRRTPARARRRGRNAHARQNAMKDREAKLQKRRRVRARQDELLAEASIEVRGRVHPGTTIVLGPHSFVVEQPMNRVRFLFDPEERRIVTESL